MSASTPCSSRTPFQTRGQLCTFRKCWKSRRSYSPSIAGWTIALKWSVEPRSSTRISAAARTFSSMVEYAWREKIVCVWTSQAMCSMSSSLAAWRLR